MVCESLFEDSGIERFSQFGLQIDDVGSGTLRDFNDLAAEKAKTPGDDRVTFFEQIAQGTACQEWRYRYCLLSRSLTGVEECRFIDHVPAPTIHESRCPIEYGRGDPCGRPAAPALGASVLTLC